MEQALTDYRQAFDQFVELTQSKELALDMASWSVSSVANNLDVLQARLADDGTYTLKDSQGQQGAEFVGQAGQVARLMLQAMDEARLRLEQMRKGAEEARQGRIEQAEQAAAQVEQLKARVSDAGYQAVLNEVSGHIVSFTKKLGEYTDLPGREQQLKQQRAEQIAAGDLSTDITSGSSGG